MTPPYARETYLASLAAPPGARALPVPAWGTAVLARAIPGGGEDAIGAYPMAVLDPAGDVAAGLEQLARAAIVCVVLVADPLSCPSHEVMAPAFDLARPFKTHHLIDPKAYAPSRHHRQEIRRSLRRCRVEEVRLAEHLATWSTLYAGLVQRHGVSGQAAFSERYFQHLASLPELVALVARVEGEIAAMGLWFAWDGVAYNHLGASSPAGYAAGAGYALYDAAVARFRDCRVLNLGGGAGLADDPADGLSAFKRGFSTGAVEAWLYGRVLDPARYAALSEGRDTPFFPAYRG